MTSPQVLVVDDEPLLCRSLVQTIQGLGYEATSAGSGEEALRQLERSPSRLVFSDIRMPGMDGLELLKQVKTFWPETCVVMITAYGSVEVAVQAMKEGASDFLMKPFSMKQVEEVLTRVFGTPEARNGHLAFHPGRRSPVSPLPSQVGIVTQDPRILEILRMVERVAPTPVPILIQGESGTGKELLARAVHRWSGRGGPFVALNCAAIPESLLESELFGYEKGAFTGAIARRIGKFEAAHRGTLLLDEVSEMPLSLQAKLLRALQEGEVNRLGDSRPVKVDTRVVATTNRNLREEVRAGRFRQDLFFRLNVVTITLPPLRERRGDIPLLTAHFLVKHSPGGQSFKLSHAAQELLMTYPWPGNIRELENCLQRAILLSSGGPIQPRDLGLDLEARLRIPDQRARGGALHEVERQVILDTLAQVGGNRTRAARVLGISVRTLRNKLREYRAEGAFSHQPSAVSQSQPL